MDQELKEYLEQRFAGIEQRMATKDDLNTLRAEIRSGDEETRRHMDVVAEDIRTDASKIAEGHQMLVEHMDRKFEEQETSFDRRARTTEAIVSGFVRRVRPLEERVSALEERVSVLEEGRKL